MHYINLCWAFSFCPSRFIICLSPHCFVPEDCFNDMPLPSSVQLPERSTSQGRREGGCFSLTASLPGCSFYLTLCLFFFFANTWNSFWVFLPLYLRSRWALVSVPPWPLQAQVWQWLPPTDSPWLLRSTYCIFSLLHLSMLSSIIIWLCHLSCWNLKTNIAFIIASLLFRYSIPQYKSTYRSSCFSYIF